jgi:hypothetical protein
MRAAVVLACLALLGACVPPDEEAASPPQPAMPQPAQQNPGQWNPAIQPAAPPVQQPPMVQPPPGAQAQGTWLPFPIPTAWPTEWPAIPTFPQPQLQPMPSLPAGPTPTPGVNPSNDAAQHCVDEINRYRASKALPALARWTDAEPCAVTEARDDSQTGQAHGTFGRCQEHAQNACPGWPGPANTMIDGCLKMMWSEGPGGGHYENMIDRKATRVACGTYAMPGGRLWSVQDFR